MDFSMVFSDNITQTARKVISRAERSVFMSERLIGVPFPFPFFQVFIHLTDLSPAGKILDLSAPFHLCILRLAAKGSG